MNKYFEKLINEMSKLDEVEAIMLAGSQQSGFIDEFSDYDVYVYLNGEISSEKRKNIIEKYSSYAEINNQFWETEDDFIIADENKLVEIIYRDFDFVENMVGNVVEKYCASIGYTTCFWSNILDSKILFDRTGKGAEIIKRFTVNYPQELKKNIVNINYPLLKDSIPAYYHQIKKALAREDYISVNHRIGAFLASYFDILFAINEIPHVGEKKLMKVVLKKCKIIPKNFEENINYLTKANWEEEKLIETLDGLIDEIKVILKLEGFLK